MNNYDIIFRKSFRNDLANIFDYLVHKGFNEHKVKNKINNLIDNIVSQLSGFPKMYDTVANRYNLYLNKNFHLLLLKQYIVIYYVNDNKCTVYVNYIFNNKQNVKKNFEELLKS